MPRVESFTFGTYAIDAAQSTVTCTYRIAFENGKTVTYTDELQLKDIPPEAWGAVPEAILTPTLEALTLMLGINYWTVYPTKNIRIEGFVLTKEQARFWDTLYLYGLGEYFYDMKMDFRGLIAFPYDESASTPAPTQMSLPKRALLLNGAGKDSILSAEMLKAEHAPFDFFSYAPTPAHERIAALVGAKTIEVTRSRDSRIGVAAALRGASAAYPSVSTFTFIATLLAELLGYDTIIFSNERSADIGNLTYLGLEVNHQWCKSSEAERITNEYIQTYITPSISSRSLLRKYSELEIVSQFVKFPKYLPYVTSCNSYFWLPWPMQHLRKKGYWCRECPKCVFLFSCFSAYLPKKQVVRMFGADLYTKWHLRSLFRRILGVEGFKPLDCVGEPEEMILAMHYAADGGEYRGEHILKDFEKFFPKEYDYAVLEPKVFNSPQM